jgi:hypothetical protein
VNSSLHHLTEDRDSLSRVPQLDTERMAMNSTQWAGDVNSAGAGSHMAG